MQRAHTTQLLAKVHAYLDCGKPAHAALYAARLIDELHDACPGSRDYELDADGNATLASA